MIDLLAQGIIVTKSVGEQIRPVEAELALFVEQVGRDLHGHNLGNEHAVGAEGHFLFDLALDIDRTFEDDRALDLKARRPGEVGFRELVHILSGHHAAPVGHLSLPPGRDIDDKFAAVSDELIGIPFGPDGDGQHGR